MVDSTSAVAVVAKEDGKERRREKERKKRSLETLDLAPADVGGAPNRRNGRDVLLKSIAAFLDTNGFSKTLSVFQSEAQLEIGCWKSSFVDLGDLFCKVLDSSNGYKEAGINWLPDQDAQKVGFSREIEDKSNAAENTHKKRKKIDQIIDGMPTEVNKTQMDKGFGEGINDGEKPAADGLQDKLKKTKAVGSGFEVLSADNASLSSSNLKEMTTLNENSDLKKSKLAEDLHLEPKEKKKKKKKVSDTTIEKDINKHLEVGCLTAEGTDPASQLPEPIERRKEKKKKCKVMPEIHDDIAEPSDSKKLKEMVNNKIEEMVSLTNNSLESSMKHKSENKKDKKLKQVAAEASKDTSEVIKDVKLVGVEGHTGSVCKNPSDDNDSQHKAKKKKEKSTPDVGTTVNSDQAGEEKSAEKMKECDINHDAGASNFGHENVPVSEDMNIKVSKRTSKKRKALDSGRKADNDNSGIESNVKTKGADNAEKIGIFVESDRSSLDNVTSVPPKKRKTEESKQNTKNAGEQLEFSNKSKENGNASNSKNEVVQMANGSTGNNSPKGKHSVEPKSVNPFQRVKMGDVKFADERLKDNSYWAKDGADIGYGAKAQEVLGQVRGRDFKHEKTKKKRGSYRGGQINLQSHSIKFSHSDDE